MENHPPKKLYRSRANRMIAGVFGGLADYTGVDATVWRIIGVALLIFTAFLPMIIFYLIAAVVIPEEPTV